MRMSDKTVIVTGAARGIGQACAQAFAAEGASVVLADVLKDECQKTSEEIVTRTGARTLAVPVDIGSDEDCEMLVSQALDQFGQIDVLINNAGIIAPGDILEISRKILIVLSGLISEPPLY